MLAVAYELQLAERGRARRGDAARHDVRARVVVIQGADRDGVRLGLHELHQQSRELPEVHPFRVGAAALGDLAGGTRDGASGALKQVGHVGGRLDSRARQLADGALDSLEEVGQRRQVGEGGEATQRLERAHDVLERVVRQRVGP